MDTNILVYVLDNKDPAKHRSAKQFLDTVYQYPDRFFISVQNVREFAFTMLGKAIAPHEKIQEYIREFCLVFTVLPDSSEDAFIATQRAATSNAPFWDALLASTGERNGIQTIYTENTKDFEKIKGIKAVNPLRG